ncbi:MAG: hypothetical protein N4A76_13650 [Firmicutes bacterium]|jgi:flagellar basal-body rod modification protein FlgD|nr:hypothetical protein [Bacillota bacterium]
MAVSGVGSSTVTNPYNTSNTEKTTEKKLGKYLTDDAKERLDALDKDAENNKKIADNKMNSQDAFMKILMTQLQNQDPLSPMENTDMISQMSQFSQLEAIQSMAEVSEGTAKSLEYLVEKADNNEIMQLEVVNQLVKLNKAMEEYFDTGDSEDESDNSDGDSDESSNNEVSES